MVIGRERFAYHAAEIGEAPDAPDALYARVQHIAGWEDLVEEAASRIVQKEIAREKGEDYGEASAWELFEGHVASDQEHHDLMRIALYRAKQDPGYWGVDNPETERYCSTCRNVRPIEMFGPGHYNCNDCRGET